MIDPPIVTVFDDVDVFESLEAAEEQVAGSAEFASFKLCGFSIFQIRAEGSKGIVILSARRVMVDVIDLSTLPK